MSRVIKKFTADGNAVNVDLGFVPDYVKAIEGFDDTNPNIYEWFKTLADDSDDGQYGLTLTGSTGIVTVSADADNGIISYEADSIKVKVPAPDGDGEVVVSVSDWSSTTNYSTGGTDRGATTAGTVVRPPTHNGKVFELTSGSGAGTSEPSSWDVEPGESVTDGGDNVFICREEKIVAHGGAGVTIGATLGTDGDEWIVIAEKFDRAIDGGDSATYDPV